MSEVRPVRRALLSVADKTGLVEFARGLVERGAVLVSSGSTAGTLREAGVAATPVSEVTGFPEMLDGRVKTLHPRIHAGILADLRKPSHRAEIEAQGIEPFDLVAVNLYPFREALEAGAGPEEAIEQIDIGGPTLIRAAAKNFESVGVVVSPSAYGEVLEELDRAGGLTRAFRLHLARRAFEHTAGYERAIAAWFQGRSDASGEPGPWEGEGDGLPTSLAFGLNRLAELRYGENPHQRGGLYGREGTDGPLGGARVIQGKEMSYNNWLDAEAARALAGLLDRPAAVIVKHHNPCGAATADTPAHAYERALDADRVSAYGGIVAFNDEVDEAAAAAMAAVFTEVVIAPSFSGGALAAFAARKSLRVVRAPLPQGGGLEVRPIEGGALVQDMDWVVEAPTDMKVVSSVQPTDGQWADLLFAWRVAARVKSNAIVLASGGATVGIGAGQMNRVNSVDLAVRQAGDLARGATMASDAFFPFRDGVDRAGEAGVAAVIQPGGSVRDEEVIAAAEEHGMAMVFTSRRHFRH